MPAPDRSARAGPIRNQSAHATFTCQSLGVLVHAKDREISDALQRGDSTLSRLDGEWWLRFAADPLVD